MIATPLTLLTLTAVMSAWVMKVETVAALQSSSIGEDGAPKTAPVPAALANTPAAVAAPPAWTGLTFVPVEVCLTISHPHDALPSGFPAVARPCSVTVTLYIPGAVGVTEATTVFERIGTKLVC